MPDFVLKNLRCIRYLRKLDENWYLHSFVSSSSLLDELTEYVLDEMLFDLVAVRLVGRFAERSVVERLAVRLAGRLDADLPALLDWPLVDRLLPAKLLAPLPFGR